LHVSRLLRSAKGELLLLFRRAIAMNRLGLALAETLVLTALILVLILPLMTLSSRNTGDSQELLERSIAQGLCLDLMERFKWYKPIFPKPALREIYLPVSVPPEQVTPFDEVYLGQMKALGMALVPRYEVIPVPGFPGFFQLDISMAWTNLRGNRREVRYSRYCYAP